MARFNYIRLLRISIFLWSFVAAQMSLFPGGTPTDVTISSGCKNALETTLDSCEQTFLYYPNADFQGPFESSRQDQFCSSTCTSSLQSYHSLVQSSCSNDPDPWDGIPATYGGDRMAAYQARICLKDPASGAYCNSMLILPSWIYP
jgi:hypothetical protein